MSIKIKRVYDTPAPEDGLRILADRLWPRGISRERLHGVIWARDTAPSNELRRWFHEDREHRWDEFRRRYEKELAGNPGVDTLADQIGRYDAATLLIAGKDLKHTHALLLKSALEKRLKNSATPA